MSKDWNKHFSKDDMQMARKYMKTSFVIREM